MKILLASAIAIILSTSVFCNVEDAHNVATEMISTYEFHLKNWEINGCRENFHYKSGYANGAIDAYKKMLEVIEN